MNEPNYCDLPEPGWPPPEQVQDAAKALKLEALLDRPWFFLGLNRSPAEPQMCPRCKQATSSGHVLGKFGMTPMLVCCYPCEHCPAVAWSETPTSK